VAPNFVDFEVVALDLDSKLFLTGHNIIYKPISELFRTTCDFLCLIDQGLKIFHSFLKVLFIINPIFNGINLLLKLLDPLIHGLFDLFGCPKRATEFLLGLGGLEPILGRGSRLRFLHSHCLLALEVFDLLF
jgi:hypothetical protein